MGVRSNLLQPLLAARSVTGSRVAALTLAIVLGGCGVTTPTRPSASAPSVGWQRINVATVPWPGGAEDVIAVDGGFLMAGFSRQGAFVLSSPDGVQWQDRSLGIEGNGAGVGIVALAEGDATTLALVDIRTGAGARMALRRSVDATEWRSLDLEMDNDGPWVLAADIVWTGVEFVVVGGRPSGGDDPTVQAIIATSTDGIEWALDRPPALDLSLARGPEAAAVWRGAPVVLATAPVGRIATLLTRDARGAWSATEMRDVRDMQVFAITATSDGLLFGGCTGDVGVVRAPMVWSDAGGDGRALVPVTLPGDDGCVVSLAGTEGDWLATGFDGGRAAVWSSPNGFDWESARPDEVFIGPVGAIARSAANVAGTWLAVGYDMRPVGSGARDTIAVWRGP